MKKLFITLLILFLLCSVTAAYADNSATVVVGADLSADDINTVYSTFGITRGSVPELYVTTSEEHALLDGFVSADVIGSRSVSCVFVRILPPGSGVSVRTSNITWCSPEIYRNVLVTAGITDADVIITSPFPVSGTAALAGIYKAYEITSGVTISQELRDITTQELTISGELAQQIGSMDTAEIVNALKLILNETVNMTDEELSAQIDAIAAQYNVSLNDSQKSKLIALCRSMEALDSENLAAKVESLKQTISTIGQTTQQLSQYAETAGEFIGKLQAGSKK